jgi:poly(A) polymerase/tRNA nucleotidyltransferase (CCA-adding enzyme)
MEDRPADRVAPPAFLAEGAPAAVLAALPGARAVGGCVRDALAGREVHDVDVAAPFPPEGIAARLRAAGLKVFETGLQHGTVTAVRDHQPVEVTALRRDVATDGRHAEVAWTTDWREDAARRDFTMNAMSMAADGRLWDYFGGRADLEAGRVRFVGDPATRLAEDYLRALRFFRFWARYGTAEPDRAALEAIRGAVEGLRRRIAPERIWMELKRLLAGPRPAAALALMEQTGIRAAVLPEGADLTAFGHALAAGVPADPVLRLAVLVPRGAGGAELPRRLRWSNEEQAQFAAARRLPDAAMIAARDEDGLRRLLADHPPARVLDRAWVLEAWGALSGAEAFRARVAAAPVPSFPVRGQDVLDRGRPPGAAVGRLVADLRRWWMEGGCVATREEALAELDRRLKEAGAADGPAAPAGATGT